MKRLCVAPVLCILLLWAWTAAAAPPPLMTTQGKVEKLDKEKETLTIQPLVDGKPKGQPIVLKLTGTTQVSTVSTKEMGGKTIFFQRDTDKRDLMPGQVIAAVYSSLPKSDMPVLLSAVVQPAEK
jgi:hypothetical protein